MREGRPSTTAAWVAAWRGISGRAARPVVHDPIAEHLVPGGYASILRLAGRYPGVMAQVHRFADAVSLGRSRHLALRTRAIDDGTHAAIEGGARQLVIVGAGLDARAWRLPSLRDTVVWEVDHPSTQAWKRARVAELPPIARDVRFVASDFERDDMRERLAAAGHDPTAPTVFVWEGVTMYLSSAAIDLVLRGLHVCAAAGSTLLATYFEPRSSPLARTLSMVLRGVSEPVRSRFSPDEIAGQLDRHAFEVIEDAGDPEWSRRYLSIAQPWSLERLVTARRR
ncbi:MAG: class I SAM-dependent methyltransferase [Deltaproteobacteria bacterium]|nr:class I SAM-dependent methyltransferase [Deltaproteobacteria bacterium]